MIANLKAGAILVLFLSLSSNLFGGELNYYQKIAKKFGVHPFEFDYGFPIWYHAPYESLYGFEGGVLPIRGIIFLTDSINYLETYSPTTYIAQPTIENAEMIAELTHSRRGYGVFYLVVDSAIIQSEMTAFIEKLAENEVYTYIRFVGASGNYVNVNYYNVGYALQQWAKPPPPVCGTRGQFSVLMNRNSQLLIEEDYTELSYLDSIIYQKITVNKNGERDINAPLFEIVTIARCESEINELKHVQEKQTGDNSIALNVEIQRLERQLKIVNRFGPIKMMHRSFFQDLKIQLRTPLKSYFQVLDQLQKGFFKARQESCIQYSGQSYLKAMKKNDLLLLELLTLTYPNHLTVEFGYDYWEFEPEPPR